MGLGGWRDGTQVIYAQKVNIWQGRGFFFYFYFLWFSCPDIRAQETLGLPMHGQRGCEMRSSAKQAGSAMKAPSEMPFKHRSLNHRA